MKTQIQVSKELWKKLNDMRELGESFDDIIRKLLKNQVKEK
jgi:predicted CopG family antitoxin